MKHKTFYELHRDGKSENIKCFFGVVNKKNDMKKDMENKKFSLVSWPGRYTKGTSIFVDRCPPRKTGSE
jgi:hypothetical protein